MKEIEYALGLSFVNVVVRKTICRQILLSCEVINRWSCSAYHVKCPAFQSNRSVQDQLIIFVSRPSNLASPFSMEPNRMNQQISPVIHPQKMSFEFSNHIVSPSNFPHIDYKLMNKNFERQKLELIQKLESAMHRINFVFNKTYFEIRHQIP